MAKQAPPFEGSKRSVKEILNEDGFDSQRLVDGLEAPGPMGVMGRTVKAAVPMGKTFFNRLVKKYGPEKAKAAKEFYEGALDEMDLARPDKLKKLDRFIKDVPEASVQKYGDKFGRGFDGETILRTGKDDVVNQSKKFEEESLEGIVNRIQKDGIDAYRKKK